MEMGQKLRSRPAVVQSQRRTDKEVGVREEHELDEAKKKMPYVKMFRKAGNLGTEVLRQWSVLRKSQV